MLLLICATLLAAHGNFIVHGPSDTAEQLEHVKTWCLQRWGFDNIDLASPMKMCMIGDCEDAYQIDPSKPLSYTVPEIITKKCLDRWEAVNHRVLRVWAKRGMMVLNGSYPRIRKGLNGLRARWLRHGAVFCAEDVFLMSSNQYLKMDAEHRELFDYESAILCLYFVQNKIDIQSILFSDPYEELKGRLSDIDKKFLYFMKDIIFDESNERLKIFPNGSRSH